MKVSVLQENLAHGLSIVTRAVSPRSTLPVLANVLVATDEGRLRLSATNLELGITCWIGAKIENEGSTTVPARTFSDLVGTLSGQRVDLDLNVRNQKLNVLSGASTTNINCIDAQEFPPMPVADPSEGIQINVADLKEMIQQVVFAASTDEARPVLTGVQLTVQTTGTTSTMTLCAADGFRLSVRKAELSASVGRAISVIIPARALSELARVATDSNQVVNMLLPPGRNQVIFRMKDVELVSQLIDGNFPDYKAIIPPSFKTHTILSTPGLLAACKQAEIIARDSTNVARLDIQPETEGEKSATLEISAVSEQTGSSEILVDASIEGTPLLVAFNVRFLREALEVIKTPNVILETNAANSPGMIRPVGDEFYKHIIMPMHLG